MSCRPSWPWPRTAGGDACRWSWARAGRSCSGPGRLLLVPLLAFDRAGYRLGWGGGFYDRTLAELRQSGTPVTAVGVGYAAQEVDAVPRDYYDARLDWVVTEEDIIRITS